LSTLPDDTRDTPPISAPSSPLTFAAGQIVADRFRIVRFIASGGMGELYEAEDRELHEHVALKTIRPDIAQDATVIARFKREAFLARRVTHPNICRIFDLFRHQPAGPGPSVTFVTMELLAGETLADRLRRGRLSADEALPLVTQMAAALDAAHQAGVVHRDFKSNNVMLVPQPDGVPRVVVTDFGLAVRPEDGASGAHARQTMTGQILGTPDYMAPEQVQGGDLTPATDVYALGLVMYEMVTGRRPFAASTPLAAAVRRLSEPPRPPGELVPDLDESWEATILRCLERLPGDRFPRAGDVVKELAAPAPPRFLPNRARIAMGVTLLAVVMASLGALLWRAPRVPPSEERAAEGHAARRSVAVLGFRNVSGRQDAAWLSTAFSEMLTTELAAGEQLRTIPGENVARMKMDLALADADAYASDTLGRIRDNLGTDLVVFGSYVTVGEPGQGTIRLDARLQDSREGQIIALVSETSPEQDVLQLVSRTGARLRERLDVDALPAAAVAAVQASLPATADAARFYSEGLERLRSFDALAARDLLERAVAADGRFPLAHSALALTWATLGYDDRARSASSRAFKLSAGLSREERLSVEGAYRETAQEWKEAIAIYQTLFRFFPDNLEYGLRLANAESSSGAPKDALATIETLRKSERTSDPRLELAEAAAAENVSDFKRMQAAAATAAARGKAQGARLIVARAALLEGTAVLRLGEPERAIALYDQARAAYAEARDRGRLAEALNSLASALADTGDVARGDVLYAEALSTARSIGHQRMVARLLNNMAVQKRRAGDLDGSLELNREALAIRREIGDRVNLAVSLNNIGNVLLDLGDLGGAVAHYEEAAGMHREIGDRRGVARARNNAAVALKMQGQLARAREANEEALAIRREIADPGSVAISLYNIGELLVLQGDLPKAVRTLDEALAIQRKLDIGRGAGYSLFELGNIALLQGETALARKHLEESLAVRTKLGEKLTAADSRSELALVALADGRAADAERLAHDAVAAYEHQGAPDGHAMARAALARALMAAGRADVALAEAKRAQALVGNSQNIVVKLATSVTAARIQGLSRSQNARTAVAELERAQAQASALGLVPLRFEALLVLAEITARSDPASADVRFAALEKEARERGFRGVAARAAAGTHPATRASKR
jgi:eukaryotic-like serine/threonine-protein kinase